MGIDIANILEGSWFKKIETDVSVDEQDRKRKLNEIEQKLSSLDKDTTRVQGSIDFLKKMDGKVLEAFDFLIDFDKKKDRSGQLVQNVRNSGELYVYHPFAVLRILVEEFGFDQKDSGFTDLFVASILHDTFEDEFEGNGKKFWKENGRVLPEIERRFGSKVVEMVEGMTKDKIYIKVGEEKKGVVNDENTFNNVMRMALVNPGIIQIREADRLHNWRTIEGMKLSKKAESVRETLEFFRPIAVKLGMTKVVAEFDENIEKVRQELVEYNRTKKPEEPTIEINEKGVYDVTPWFSQLGVIDHAEVLKK